MSNYRRASSGNCFFFTVVTYNRLPIFEEESFHPLLRSAIEKTHCDHPFTINAWVLMPDHMHCIWTLPDGDHNFSTRWSLIKSRFSHSLPKNFNDPMVSLSKHLNRRRGIWQRRFWEHQIRNEVDYINHMNYLHFNPVKHGLVRSVKERPFSSFHRYVKQGVYPIDWGKEVKIVTGQYGE